MRIRLRVEALESRALPAVRFQTLPVFPFSNPAVLDHARAIFAHGQQLGRQSNVFTTAGDSNTYPANLLPQSYLIPLGAASYNPTVTNLTASHPELLDTWSTYRASFARVSSDAYPGWTAADVLAHAAGEIAASNASIAMVMVGTNDVFVGTSVTQYQSELSQLVTLYMSQGVLPVLSTIPTTMFQGTTYHAAVKSVNQVIADVAAMYRVPLWNFWATEIGLPNLGLEQYGVHLNASPNGGGSFYPADLAYAQNVHNLEALENLDWFHSTVAGGSTFIAPSSSWQTMVTGHDLYAVGHDVGFSPTVDVYNASSGLLVNRFLAFGRSFSGGVRVAMGDVNGDGYLDVVCATGSGMTAKVNVFSGKDGRVLARLTPFGASYTGGSNIAVGDLNGDGIEDIVVGRAQGGAGIKVYQGGTFAPISSFRAFDGEAGGVSVAVANVKGIGPVIAVGASESPTVGLFDPSGSMVSSFTPFPGSGYGVTLTAVDLNGDGFDELAVTGTVGWNQVAILDPVTQAVLAGFTAAPVIDKSFSLRLGAVRSSTGGNDRLLIGNAPGSPVSVLGFDDLTGTATQYWPTNANRAYGIFVG